MKRSVIFVPSWTWSNKIDDPKHYYRPTPFHGPKQTPVCTFIKLT